MIESITVENYRSHEKNTFELHPNVNVLVGRGQAGKSNIMRAVDTLRTNRPRGTRYRSRFAGRGEPVRVTIREDGGRELVFERNSEGVVYWLDGQDYRKVGTKVPEPIKEALNMVDLNLQWQHDAPYLISGSVGQIGKAINAVIDFEEIDQWLSQLRSMATTIAQSKKALNRTLLDINGKLASLPDTKAAGNLIAKAELLDARVRQDQKVRGALQRSVEAVERYDHDLNHYKPMLAAEGVLEQARQTEHRIRQMEDERAWLLQALALGEDVTQTEGNKKLAETKLWEAVLRMGRCPTCGQEINKEHLDHILEAL